MNAPNNGLDLAGKSHEEKVDAIALWAAEHHGRIEAWWHEQRKTNRRIDTDVIELEGRLISMENKQVEQDKLIDRLIVRNGLISAGAVVVATIVMQWLLGKL